LAYAYLTDEYYNIGRWFGPILAFFTVLLSSITLLILILLYSFRKNKRQLNSKFIKLVFIPLLGLLPFFIIKSIPNELDNSLIKVKVTYIAYACECANWRIIEYNSIDVHDSIEEDIFLEALNPKKELPLNCFQIGKTIELSGRFYKRKGFPKDYINSEQQPEKARVFQYESYKIIRK
jgi:hypothetical protein